MNLTHDAMLVSLRINAWSGRLYDRQASNHVAAHHEASASAGRYNKRLLPKAAFAALTATMSAARSSHYDQSLPWDDQGSRLLTVANYERYTELLKALRERVVRVNGGGIMLHARRPGGPVAAAQNCATHGPLSVATRGRRCTAWSSMRRFDWRLSTRV